MHKIYIILHPAIKQNRRPIYKLFYTIGEKLSNKVPTNQANHFQTYLAKRVSESMYREPANINEIVHIILSLNGNKTVGYDQIPAYFLKIAPFTIAPLLLMLINYAFSNGIFPITVEFLK